MTAGTPRVVVIGDDLVAGLGDARGLGWTGRVQVQSGSDGAPVDVLALGVPGETSSGLAARWQAEVLPRLEAGAPGRLIVALGSHDLEAGISPSRSRLNLAQILDEATTAGIRTFVVGPPPTGEPERHEGIAALSAAFADVAGRRGVNVVDTFTPLRDHDQWREDTAHGRSPSQVGYGLLAWLVLNRGWREWLNGG